MPGYDKIDELDNDHFVFEVYVKILFNVGAHHFGELVDFLACRAGVSDNN